MSAPQLAVASSLIEQETEYEEDWAWGQARPTGGVAEAIFVFQSGLRPQPKLKNCFF
ncbi:MAG: hypothetical protein ACQERT_00785 [Thermodesulfobacteriota bacterium]